MTRMPPKPVHYPDAGLTLGLAMFSGYFNTKTAYAPKFNAFPSGITADQAREAAHLLNQLAEYLEWQARQDLKSTAEQNGCTSPERSSASTKPVE